MLGMLLAEVLRRPCRPEARDTSAAVRARAKAMVLGSPVFEDIPAASAQCTDVPAPQDTGLAAWDLGKPGLVGAGPLGTIHTCRLCQVSGSDAQCPTSMQRDHAQWAALQLAAAVAAS